MEHEIDNINNIASYCILAGKKNVYCKIFR